MITEGVLRLLRLKTLDAKFLMLCYWDIFKNPLENSVMYFFFGHDFSLVDRSPNRWLRSAVPENIGFSVADNWRNGKKRKYLRLLQKINTWSSVYNSLSRSDTKRLLKLKYWAWINRPLTSRCAQGQTWNLSIRARASLAFSTDPGLYRYDWGRILTQKRIYLNISTSQGWEDANCHTELKYISKFNKRNVKKKENWNLTCEELNAEMWTTYNDRPLHNHRWI